MAEIQRAFSRRRILGLIASAAAFTPGLTRAADLQRHVWRGVALGANARMVLYHEDRREAEKAIAASVDEIRRLEQEFSLYIRDSAISILNRTGRLDMPSLDMIRLLAAAQTWGDRTAGAFDITVQPLWALHAAYASTQNGLPPQEAIEVARARVDYRGIRLRTNRITLPPGVAITLNGIAQGYITDRIADLLRQRGWRHVMINLGEIRALDGKPDGSPWRIGLRPDASDSERMIPIADRAIATSSGSGTVFDPDGQHHHLFDPQSGHSANTWRQVTVTAPDAETADALSTALYVIPADASRTLLGRLSACEAWLEDSLGQTVRIG